MMKTNESTGRYDPDRQDSTDSETTDDTDDGLPHPHWLLRARLAHERLSGGGDR